ncbi:MAG: autotransporter domain-containing protein [Candidatus Omnitrophota bacterium]|jgi:uncharacterized protein with beta-barrel porin domain
MKKIILFLAILFTCSTTFAAETYSQAINQAIDNAMNPSGPPDWRASDSSIISINSSDTHGLQYNSSGKLIVRNVAKSSNFSSNYVGQADYAIYGQPAASATWVTTGNDFTEFYKDHGGITTNTALINVVERGLGMDEYTNVTKYHNAIVEFAVTADNNHIMRPSKNPDATTYNRTQYGDSDTDFPFRQPTGMSDTVYKNFKDYYASWYASALTGATFPWTQLGYSYFWGNGASPVLTLDQIQGMTEFILPGQTPVTIYAIYSTASYIYTKNKNGAFSSDADAQYGNGFPNFNVTGACDTLWAGHSFQNNVSRSASSPNTITIASGQSVSGGEGILVWSLNYKVTNNGTISGTTRNKYNIAGTDNIGILFMGDTSTDYGTPITSGINELINSATGIIGDVGAGTAVKIVNGDTTITNSGTIRGATAVEIASGTTTITNSGAGAIAGDVVLTSSGAMNLSNDQLEFTGDYTQASTSALKLDVNSLVLDYGSMNIIGAATLGGTLKTTTTGSYALGDVLTDFIQTTGGVTGTFDTLDTPITPTIIWKPLVGGDDIDLVATRDYDNYPLRQFLNDNQRNVASVMQLVLPAATGDLAVVKNAIDGLSTNAQVADAYSQTSPDRLSGIPNIAFTSATMQFANLQSHMEELRTGIPRGMSFNTFTGSFAGNLLKQDRVLIAYDGDDWAKFSRESNTHAATDKKFGFFINGEGDFGNQGAFTNEPGFDYVSGGVTAGFDYKLLNGLIVGADVGYLRTSSSLGGAGGSIDIDSISYGLYSTYSWKILYLDLAAQFASNIYHTDRKINFGGLDRNAKANPFGQQWTIAGGTGCDFHVKSLVTGPTLTMKYSQLWIDSFLESGADSLDLDVSAQDAQSCQFGIGWRAEYELRIDKHVLFPEAHISFQHEFLNDSRSIEAKLAGSVFNTSTGENKSPDFCLLGCGMAFRLTNSVLFNVQYQAQVGQYKYVAQNVNGNVKIYF